MTEILEQLNNLKELGYIQKAHLNVLEVALEDYKTEIRAKAIDEFAEKLSLEVSESIIWDMLATMSKNSSLSDTSDKIVDYVINTANEIAERLKAGGENEND